MLGTSTNVLEKISNFPFFSIQSQSLGTSLWCVQYGSDEMGQTSCKNFIRARPPADTGAVRPSNTINKRLISALAGCPPLKCTFYYETQVFVQQLQLPLLYDLPGPGRSGTMLKELEMELREKLKLAVGSSVFAVVPADELYSPPYPLAMINVVDARLYSRTENIHVPVLHFALVVRNMALLSQPIL